MKKTIALLLAVLMILSMVACAANTPAKTEEPATTQTETTTPDTTETEEPAATEEPATEEHEPATLEVFLAQVDWADALLTGALWMVMPSTVPTRPGRGRRPLLPCRW